MTGFAKVVGSAGRDRLVELADGKRFALRVARERAPVGAIVVFRYDELSDLGKPRNPLFLEVRDDLETWPFRPPSPESGALSI